jgi:hypothetical protein
VSSTKLSGLVDVSGQIGVLTLAVVETPKALGLGAVHNVCFGRQGRLEGSNNDRCSRSDVAVIRFVLAMMWRLEGENRHQDESGHLNGGPEGEQNKGLFRIW